MKKFSQKLFGNCNAGFQPAVLVASSRQFERYLLELAGKKDKFGGWKPPRQPARCRRYVFFEFPNSFSGKSDANINFEDLRKLLLILGFEERIKLSHHIFRKEGIAEKPNLQKDGSKAKTYQVKQIRGILQKYDFGEK